jgi:predicted MFS family arabinose efflux permease
MSSVERSDGLNLGLAGRIVVLLGLTLSSYGLFAPMPVLPAVAAAFASQPHADALARSLVGAVGITMAVAAPIMGAITDAMGPRRVLFAALAAYAVLGCIPFFLHDLRAILATRIVFAFAVAAFGTVTLSLVASHAEGDARQRWIGYATMVTTLAGLVLYPLVGQIGRLGWRWPFLTYIIAAPLFLLSIVGFPPNKDGPARDLSELGRPGPALGTPVGFIAFAILAGGVMLSPAVFLPFRIRELGIVDSGQIGLLLLPTSIAAAIAGYAYGPLRTRLSTSGAFLLGFASMAAGVVMSARAQDIPHLMFGQVLAGLGVGVNVPSLFALAATTGPDRYRARTIGFTNSGIYGGPMLGQLMLEPVVARSNVGVAQGVIGAICGVFALFYAVKLIADRLSSRFRTT